MTEGSSDTLLTLLIVPSVADAKESPLTASQTSAAISLLSNSEKAAGRVINLLQRILAGGRNSKSRDCSDRDY